jgi:hypothetical protein
MSQTAPAVIFLHTIFTEKLSLFFCLPPHLPEHSGTPLSLNLLTITGSGGNSGPVLPGVPLLTMMNSKR